MSQTRLYGVMAFVIAGGSALGLETPFGPRQVIDTTGDNPRTALIADVDNDGDNDVVVATLADNTFAWFENDGDPEGISFTKHVLSSTARGAREVWVADINRDGRLDILGAARQDNEVLWYRNEGGTPATFTEFLIADDVLSSWSVYAADIDGDGDLDVTSAGRDDDRISWHENDGNDPPTWTKHVIDTNARRAQKAFADDVDGDGDVDMLSASGAGDEIAWYENDGAPDPTFTKHSLTTSANNAKWVWTADLDRDGDVDILAAVETEATVEWFENDGAADPSFTRRTIDSVPGAKACIPFDFDHDGDLDVLSNGVGADQVFIHENLGGAPLQWETHLVTTESDNPLTAFPGDLDGDGRADIVVASFMDDTIGWYRNEWIHPTTSFPVLETLDRYSAGFESMTFGDVDRDGNSDLVMCAPTGEVQWVSIGKGETHMAHPVATLTSPSETAIADLNGDGAPDVAASDLNGTVYVCTSDGAATPSFSVASAATGLGALSGINAFDLDGDSDVDLVVTSASGDVVVLFNDGNSPASFSVTTIDTTASGARDPEIHDINTDGAPDIIVPAADLDRVILYQGNGDTPATFTRRELPNSIPGPWDVEVLDLNADGYDDLAVALVDGFVLHMMLNDGGEDPVLSGFGWSAANLVAIDGAEPRFDGLPDVVGFSLADDTIRYGENFGGQNPFLTITSMPFTRPDVRDLEYEDFNHDGLPDIVLLTALDGASNLSWLANRGGQAALASMSIASEEALIGRVVGAFMVTVANHGSRGDESVALSGLTLRFRGPDDQPLTTAQAQALIRSVRVYGDSNRSSAFEYLGDTLLYDEPISELDANGVTRIDIDPVTSGFMITYSDVRAHFVAVELRDDANTATPNQFNIEVLPGAAGDVMQLAPDVVPVRLEDRLGAVTPLMTATVPAPGQVLFGDAWIRHTIDNSLHGAEGPRGADVNGDGLTDYSVGWEQSFVSKLYLHPGHENVRSPWPGVIAGNAPNVETAVPHDLDGDGDFEILSAISAGPRTIRAHFPPDNPADLLDESMWSTETFTQTPLDLWINIEPADIDGENGLDLIIGSIGRDGNFDAQIGWLRCPEDPSDTDAWTYHHLAEVEWALTLESYDVDHDGDQDVVFSNRFGINNDRGVFWLENPGADSPDFLTADWTRHLIGSRAGEVGYLDVINDPQTGLPKIATPVRPRKTDIHTALDGSGMNWESVQLPWPDDMGPTKAARFADVDLDGDLDLVLTAVEAREDEGLVGVAWLRNPGTPGGDWFAYDISGIAGEKFDIVAIEDVDGDGDLDVLASDEPDNDPDKFGLGFVWYENPAIQQTGDANRDRVTNSLDLALLLSQWGAANFLTASDLNYDGKVDSLDLAIVLSQWGRQWGPGAGE